MSPRPPGRAGVSRPIGIAAIAALAIATVALVWSAVDRGTPVGDDVTAVPIPDFTPTGSPTPEPPLTLGPQSRLIVALDEQAAWRTGTLSCTPDATAAIEYTDDAGTTWASHPLGEVAVAAILGIEPFDGDEVVAVVSQSAADCAVGYEMSFTGGEFWRHETGEVPEVAYAVPGESALVVGAARLEIDCATPSDLAVRNASEAAVLCDDAVLRTTADAAVTWQRAELDAKAVAVTTIDRGYLVAEVRNEECPGVRLTVLRANDAGQEPLACLAALDETTPIALAVAGDAVWVWAADRVAVSTDGGRSWPAAWTQAPDDEPGPEDAEQAPGTETPGTPGPTPEGAGR